MVTLRRDGSPHAVRVGVAMVDGKIWSSGTEDRVRTRHLRHDPRATLFVFDPQWRWLSLDATVRILDGPDAPDLNLRLFQRMQPQAAAGTLTWFGAERSYDEFLEIMRDERRLIYEFEPRRVRGMYGDAP
jgi:PPOX class probable F420-dependent enzyme